MVGGDFFFFFVKVYLSINSNKWHRPYSDILTSIRLDSNNLVKQIIEKPIQNSVSCYFNIFGLNSNKFENKNTQIFCLCMCAQVCARKFKIANKKQAK